MRRAPLGPLGGLEVRVFRPRPGRWLLIPWQVWVKGRRRRRELLDLGIMAPLVALRETRTGGGWNLGIILVWGMIYMRGLAGPDEADMTVWWGCGRWCGVIYLDDFLWNGSAWIFGDFELYEYLTFSLSVALLSLSPRGNMDKYFFWYNLQAEWFLGFCPTISPRRLGGKITLEKNSGELELIRMHC